MKLLFIEDDVKLATAVRRGLTAEGFTVELASSGTDGLWAATENTYDLILLDIMLPGRSGFEICTELRRAGDWTPILMLTAKDGDQDQVEALDSGADDYLVKPFRFAVLVSRVRALLRRAATRAPTPTVAGDLRVDSMARRVWCGDVEIGLTAREFDVLEFFVRHVDVAVTKTQILAGVWADDFEGDPNIVEVYVGRLRRKIDEPFERSSLETLRGAGYRLNGDG